MGIATSHYPALLFLAAFSRHESALDWAKLRAAGAWGTILFESEPFDFVETRYYESTMGADLKKRLFAFEMPFEPSRLPEIKHQTNAWELDFAQSAGLAEPRPLNLDPGYITLAKLVLASTKDHSHRLYLSDGIFGEVTLYYSRGAWQSREWTYADYRRPDVQAFLTQCREWLHERLRREGSA